MLLPALAAIANGSKHDFIPLGHTLEIPGHHQSLPAFHFPLVAVNLLQGVLEVVIHNFFHELGFFIGVEVDVGGGLLLDTLADVDGLA